MLLESLCSYLWLLVACKNKVRHFAEEIACKKKKKKAESLMVGKVVSLVEM